MKIVTTISAIIVYLSLSVFSVYAQTDGDIDEKINRQADDLKQRVASRVAELNLVEKRGLMGEITEVSGTRISIKDLEGNTRFIDVDELTQFRGEEGKSLGISDLQEGITIGALGLYNKESRRLLARFIDVLSIPELVLGGISTVDEKEFIIKVTTENGITYIVDVEKITNTLILNNDGQLEKSGFSELSVRKNIVVIGFFSPKEKNRLTASKILYIEDIPLNPKISAIENVLSDDEPKIPSTGSGRKIIPL